MKRLLIILMGLVFATAVFSCTASDDEDDATENDDDDDDNNDDDSTPNYDPQQLEAYRSVIPAKSMVQVNLPSSFDAAKTGLAPQFAAGDAAFIPALIVPVAMNINGLVGSLLDTVGKVAALPPTFYNSATSEFVWGPFDNEDSPMTDDKALMYIKDNYNEPDQDFRYFYILAVGVGEDTSTYVPVILGGVQPDASGNPDHGMGVMVWDFDAGVAFEDEHNAGHGALTEGGFAAIYQRGVPDDNPDGVVTWVMAAFRDFLPEDDQGGQGPYNFDYLWGSFEDNANRLDFVDFVTKTDINNDGSAQEDMSVFGYFYNSGVGRGTIRAENGDLDPDPNVADDEMKVEGAECWNTMVKTEYLDLQLFLADGSSAGSLDATLPVADETACTMDVADFIPQISDIKTAEPDLYSQLEIAASDGIGPIMGE